MPVTYGRVPDRHDHFWRVLYILTILALVAFLSLGGCGTMVDSEDAIKVLETQGYSEVKIVDEVVAFVYWQGCGSGDHKLVRCKAKNPVGRDVQVDVCLSVLKGGTIRVE